MIHALKQVHLLNKIFLIKIQESKCISCIKNYCTGRNTFLWTNPRVEKKYRQIDNVTDEYSLIYKSPSEKFLRGCYYSVMAMITCPIISGIYMYNNPESFEWKEDTDVHNPITGNEMTYGNPIVAITLFGMGYIIFSLVIIRLCKISPLRIYTNSEKMYKIVLMKPQPSTTETVTFHLDSFKLKYKQNDYLPWTSYLFQVKNKTILILPEYFRSTNDYKELTNLDCMNE